MKRGTTPTHTFTLPFDVSTIKKVRILYAQAGTVRLTKETGDVFMDGRAISVTLTQEDTLALTSGNVVDIQIRVLTQGDDSLVSDIVQVYVERLLENEVLQ